MPSRRLVRGVVPIIAAWATLLCTQAASADTGDRDLHLWMTPMEGQRFATGRRIPTAAEQNLFLDNLPTFFRVQYGNLHVSSRVRVDTGIRQKMSGNPEFASQVLGQRELLLELSRFLEEEVPTFSGRITVTFLDWEELLARLERPAADAQRQADIVVVPSSWTTHLAQRGVLSELANTSPENYLAKPLGTSTATVLPRVLSWSAPTDRWAHAAIDWLQSPRPYALPWSVDVRLLFYWKDRFPPNARLRTRAELVDALRYARDRQAVDAVFVPPLSVAAARDWDLIHLFSLFLWNSGGDWSMHPFRTVLPQTETREVTDFLHGLAAERLIALPPAERRQVEQDFLEKRVGSIVAGPWLMARLRERDVNWESMVGVAVPPLGSRGTAVTFLGGLHLGLTPTGAMHPQGRPLLDFLTLKGAESFAATGALMPGSRNGFARFVSAQAPQSSVGGVLSEALQHVRTYPSDDEWATVVEAEATRQELYQFFKDLGDGSPKSFVVADLDALRDRLTSELVVRPRVVLIIIVLASAAGAVIPSIVAWRRGTRYRNALEQRQKSDSQIKEVTTNLEYVGKAIEAFGDNKEKREELFNAIPPLMGRLGDATIANQAATAALRESPGRLEEIERVEPFLLPSLADIFNIAHRRLLRVESLPLAPDTPDLSSGIAAALPVSDTGGVES